MTARRRSPIAEVRVEIVRDTLEAEQGYLDLSVTKRDREFSADRGLSLAQRDKSADQMVEAGEAEIIIDWCRCLVRRQDQ